jgi:hypothetical protein
MLVAMDPTRDFLIVSLRLFLAQCMFPLLSNLLPSLGPDLLLLSTKLLLWLSPDLLLLRTLLPLEFLGFPPELFKSAEVATMLPAYLLTEPSDQRGDWLPLYLPPVGIVLLGVDLLLLSGQYRFPVESKIVAPMSPSLSVSKVGLMYPNLSVPASISPAGVASSREMFSIVKTTIATTRTAGNRSFQNLCVDRRNARVEPT